MNKTTLIQEYENRRKERFTIAITRLILGIISGLLGTIPNKHYCIIPPLILLPTGYIATAKIAEHRLNNINNQEKRRQRASL
jgi:hypothetical protein